MCRKVVMTATRASVCVGGGLLLLTMMRWQLRTFLRAEELIESGLKCFRLQKLAAAAAAFAVRGRHTDDLG